MHLGFGGAPIGGLYEKVTETDAARTLRTAWQLGVRYFDTAPLYGSGLSEERIGRMLADHDSGEAIVSTKVGRRLVADPSDRDPNGYLGHSLSPVFDFSERGITESLEGSMQRLGVSYIDIVYIHDPDDHWTAALDQAYPTLDRFRAEGLIGAVGVGMNQVPMLSRFVTETDIDCVLLAGRYSLLDRSAEERLLPLCQSRGVDVIVGGVFNSGILADPSPAATFDYKPAPRSIVASALSLQEVCRANAVSLTAAAIQFPLRHPAVAAVLVGARSAQEIAADVEASIEAIPDPVWAMLDEVEPTAGHDGPTT